jgi:uncharacterized protein YlaI
MVEVKCYHCDNTITVDVEDEYTAHCELKDAGWMWMGQQTWVCPQCKTRYSKYSKAVTRRR